MNRAHVSGWVCLIFLAWVSESTARSNDPDRTILTAGMAFNAHIDDGGVSITTLCMSDFEFKYGVIGHVGIGLEKSKLPLVQWRAVAGPGYRFHIGRVSIPVWAGYGVDILHMWDGVLSDHGPIIGSSIRLHITKEVSLGPTVDIDWSRGEVAARIAAGFFYTLLARG